MLQENIVLWILLSAFYRWGGFNMSSDNLSCWDIQKLLNEYPPEGAILCRLCGHVHTGGC